MGEAFSIFAVEKGCVCVGGGGWVGGAVTLD